MRAALVFLIKANATMEADLEKVMNGESDSKRGTAARRRVDAAVAAESSWRVLGHAVAFSSWSLVQMPGDPKAKLTGLKITKRERLAAIARLDEIDPGSPQAAEGRLCAFAARADRAAQVFGGMARLR